MSPGQKVQGVVGVASKHCFYECCKVCSRWVEVGVKKLQQELPQEDEEE